MPIKPQNKPLYPKNWDLISKLVIVERAKNKCEICGVHNHAVGYRNENGDFIPLDGNYILEDYGGGIDHSTGQLLSYKAAKNMADFTSHNDEMGHKYFVIVLTTAHLDHDPRNCSLDNLKAMCQKCHNAYDVDHRKGTRYQTKMTGQMKLTFI
jgi:hypothetical protein